jgi:histidinol-phosphate aminotransferase
MTAYVPGEQPAPGERIIKLNTNENPYPPSARVMAAIRELDPDRLRRYPNPVARDFTHTAARVHGVASDMIIAGNGSDEILGIVMRTFLGAGDVLACPDPTYSLYPVLAAINESQIVTVPWAAGWALPVDALVATGARAIFFANPNAPSGTLAPAADVRELCRRFPGLVLIDEAYVDFASENCLALVGECSNAMVLRTLSKGYSLAGLRFGYAIAAAPLVAAMMKVKDSYNTDAISEAAACAALDDQTAARATWDKVRAERARLTAELSRRGFVVLPSEANFVLATVPGGDGSALYQSLKAHGILVRFFDKPGLRDKIRITIGTAQEGEALLAALG